MCKHISYDLLVDKFIDNKSYQIRALLHGYEFSSNQKSRYGTSCKYLYV